MTVYLVRHAEAGPRTASTRDRDRPLTGPGIRQADLLAGILRAGGIARVLSSPFARCRQTVTPLAEALGLEIEDEPVLAEGADPAGLLALLGRIDRTAVLCSHGDVIGGLLLRLAADGIVPRSGLRAEKGSTWVLQLGDGEVRRARYLSPPMP